MAGDLEPHTPEWDDEARRRRGHPHGSHVRSEDAEMPPRLISDYLKDGSRSDLAAMLDRLHVGAGPPPPAGTDMWKHASVLVAAAGLALTVIGSAYTIVESNTRLYDKVDTLDSRLGIVEKRQTDNIPRLDAQVTENKMQNDRIQAFSEAIADERRAREADEDLNRKAASDIMAIIAKLADKVADIDKAVAVMGAGRHSDIGRPEHDAQVVPGR